jgi:hypothetical protein
MLTKGRAQIPFVGIRSGASPRGLAAENIRKLNKLITGLVGDENIKSDSRIRRTHIYETSPSAEE